MMKTLFNFNETIDLIKSGQVLTIAGDVELLKTLPKGNWIGGSIPYFMTENGGMCTKDFFQITILPKNLKVESIKMYSSQKLQDIPNDYPNNGLSFVLIPASSEAHLIYAQNCSSWKNFYNSPILGWITGVDLSELKTKKPIVVNGQTGELSDSSALVMHLSLPENLYSQINILNLFKQGSGDIITFPNSGFTIEDCFINGVRANFAEYLKKSKVSSELPLVANYHGALVNASFKAVNETTVEMYAPIFKGIEYKVAAPLENYEEKFNQEVSKHKVDPVFSCNCILNYMYAHLEGKKTGAIKGPMTFGEIAYILLNQTMVYLTFEERK